MLLHVVCGKPSSTGCAGVTVGGNGKLGAVDKERSQSIGGRSGVCKPISACVRGTRER